MTARTVSVRLLALAGVLFAGCAPQRAVLLPVPPSEIRKEAPGPVVPPSPPAAAPAPGPDYAKIYREAVSRTRELLQRGEGRKAIPLWEALGESPYAADAAFNQGVLLQLSGDAEGASAQYRRAASPPLLSVPAAANLLGIALLRGDREALREIVDNAVRPVAALPGNRLPEFSSNLIAALVELSRPEEAEAVSVEMAARGSSTPALPWNRAVLAHRKGNLEDARRFSASVPASVSALWPVAASRVAWERDTAKVPPLDAVAGADPRLKALSGNLAAHDAWRRGDAAAARDLLLSATAGGRPPAEYLTNLGMVLAETGKWKEARGLLERAVSEAPALPEAWLNLGLFREAYLGDGPGALQCYDRYVKLNGWRKDEVAKWSEWLRKSPSPR